MKKIFALAFLAFTFNTYAQTVDSVIDKFEEATGGAENWDNVKSYTLKQSFVANAPTDFEQEVNVDVAAESMSRKKTIMKRDFFYIVNKQNGWLKIPMGSLDQNVKYNVKDLSSDEKSSMKEEIKDGLFPFINYKAKGYTASLDGTEKVDGKTCQKLVLKKGGNTLSYSFDTATGLLMKEVHASKDDTETWEHKDYQTLDSGIKFPKKSTYVSKKYKKLNTVTTALSINKEIKSSVFDKE